MTKKPTKWLVLERKYDLWDTIAWCAENHKMVWLKYQTVDGEIISRRVAPYSYRTRYTEVRGKATYFYGQDFTPGEDHTIKCFLIDNCIQAKRSNASFSPKFPIEIKQEIDELERKREQRRLDREKKKRQDDRKMKANIRSQKQTDADLDPDDISWIDSDKGDDLKKQKKQPKSTTSPTLKHPEKKPMPTKQKPQVSEPKEVEKEEPMDNKPEKVEPPTS